MYHLRRNNIWQTYTHWRLGFGIDIAYYRGILLYTMSEFFLKAMKSAHKFDNATPFLKTVCAVIP